MVTIKESGLQTFYPKDEIESQTNRFEHAQNELKNHRYFGRVSENLDDVRFFRASGRANLAGCHTDHQNGHVLPIALSDDTIIAVRENKLGKFRIYANQYRQCKEIDLKHSLDSRDTEKGDWISMFRGAAYYLLQEADIPRNIGLDMVVDGTVGVGSGKSSSASVEVAAGKTIDGMYNLVTDPVKLAKLMRAVENNYYGKPCGQMDQMISACGKTNYALKMQFTREDPIITEIDILPLVKQGYRIVIVESGEVHSGLDDLYKAIKDDMQEGARILMGSEDENLLLGDVPFETYEQNKHKLPKDSRTKLRTEYWFEEQKRVELIAKAFSEGDILEAGRLWKECAYGSRYKLQNTHIPGQQKDGQGGQEILLDLAVASNLSIGDANFGGGFGGPTRHLVKSDKVEQFISYMLQKAREKGLDKAKAKAYTPAQGEHVRLFLIKR